MSKKLSILICSLEERTILLNELVDSLEKQKTDEVEIIVEIDNREITTGAKRNILLERAAGDYIAFIDDDDQVAEDYVTKILTAVKSDPDCCGMEGILFHKKKRNRFIHSIKYDRWFKMGGTYLRCPNHLNPVKREIALQVRFPDITIREDKDYSMRLRSLLLTEEYIKGTMYYYLRGY